METIMEIEGTKQNPINSLLVREINWMETLSPLVIAKTNLISLLVREINWMETALDLRNLGADRFWPPYSLGKLIEWKLSNESPCFFITRTPYSLGKLIEWKPAYKELGHEVQILTNSLLVREINWMETNSCFKYIVILYSWTPYSLGKLIEWKQNEKGIRNRHIVILVPLPTR